MKKPKHYAASCVTQHNCISLLNTLKGAAVCFSICIERDIKVYPTGAQFGIFSLKWQVSTST